jgi:hypothetical protein
MTTILLALLATAQAAPPASKAPTCDAKGLEKTVVNASPSQMADAFLALAKCDPARAKKNVGRMKNMLPDATSIPTAIEALKIGLGDDVRDWIGQETPDIQSRFVGKLGEACAENPELVTGWFEKAANDLGKDFYAQRWHRGLDDCRTPGIQTLLTNALTSDVVPRNPRNRGEYFGVVEVWARNLGAAAVPKLAELLGTAKDEEEAMLFVSSFSDAARVGAADFDEATAKAAAAAIVEAAPKLPGHALERARDTLISLKEPALADGLAKFAFPDRFVDGRYTWGVALIEDATCKNGKHRTALHLGTFTQPGDQWRDELESKVQGRLTTDWAPDVGAKCKGTSSFTAQLSDEPLTTEALATWQEGVRKAFAEQSADAQKTTEVAHEAFAW